MNKENETTNNSKPIAYETWQNEHHNKGMNLKLT